MPWRAWIALGDTLQTIDVVGLAVTAVGIALVYRADRLRLRRS